MTHWHDYNPWADHIIYVPSIAEVLGKEQEKRILSDHDKVDAYILPQSSGYHSFGIRYGKEDYEYLSPYVYDKKDLLDELIIKYGGRQ